MNALGRWRDALAALAIPEQVLAAAPESPWGLPPELFRRRAETAVGRKPSALVERALEVLPQDGTVIDVGVGGGATSLPLGDRAARITGVDGSEEMIGAFRTAAATVDVRVDGVVGGWPGVAADVPPADVVVCGHVLYNAPDLAPFARALTKHARHRVLVEITASHPLAWMGDLWRTFHGLTRPDGPTADDAEAALREVGPVVEREDREAEPRSGGFAHRADAIALVRRRLCLPPDRDEEIARALGDRLSERGGLWSAGPRTQRIVTMWWPGSTR
jgi:SAM-dependent methyltransferase